MGPFSGRTASVSKWYGTIGLAVAVAAGVAWSVEAQQPAGAIYSSAGRNDLITYCTPVEGKPTALTVIDPTTRRIAVYHVNRESGEIQLKSVRNITGDLGLEYFNSGSPLPDEISKMQKRVQ
jgi:hypothetical protein